MDHKLKVRRDSEDGETSDDEIKEIVRQQEEEAISTFRAAGISIQRFSDAQQEFIYKQRLEKQKFRRELALGGDLLTTPVVKEFDQLEEGGEEGSFSAANMLMNMFASLVAAQPCLTYEAPPW